MDATTLKNYITRYGWSYEQYDQVVVAGLETAAGNLLIAFQLSPPWLRLSVPMLAPGNGRSADFYTQLLQLNERTRMARFGLSESGDVMACIDLYTQPELPFSQFELALDVLAYVADNALPYLQEASGEEEMER